MRCAAAICEPVLVPSGTLMTSGSAPLPGITADAHIAESWSK